MKTGASLKYSVSHCSPAAIDNTVVDILWPHFITRSEGRVIWAGVPEGHSPPCQVWWPQALSPWRYNGLSLSCDPLRPRDQRVMRVYELGPLKPSHYRVTCSDHRHCGSGDIDPLVVQEEISDAFTSIRHCCFSLKNIT